MIVRILAVSSLSFLALQACTMALSVSPAAGRSIYDDKCAVCHGSDGKGNGPLASDLETLPPDLTKIAARRDGVWPMLEVMSIVDGYSQRYLPGTEMPIYDEFLEGDLVTFDTGNGMQHQTPAGLLAIAKYLETIQDPRPDRYVP
jgi:mono/diheme cytochrome c family protein